jgi:colanic acid biosynthesis protein WcaH
MHQPQDAVAMLDAQAFQAALAAVPLVSLDLVIVRGTSEVLLGLRTNRPAQNFWFVPGGRIYKNERMQAAMLRIAEKELGLGVALSSGKISSQPMGTYEHFYTDCFAGDVGVSTHYVVLAHLFKVDADFALPTTGDQQHSALRWWPIAEALAATEVHQMTKDYLVALNAKDADAL